MSIKIGIVGAGANTRLKHIPEFQKIDGVEISAVCNSTVESGQKVADEFGIENVYSSWEEIITDDSIDAVMIGTWPYMHKIITTAALSAGKHVLCEARMAMNADEARQMLELSQEYPELITQIVPAPFTFPFDLTIQDLTANNFLGDILAVNVRFSGSDFLSRERNMSWRENIELSGLNTMMMGIVYESLARWIGHAKNVNALSRVFSGMKLWHNRPKAVEIPEHLDIIAAMHCGAQANMQFSSVTGLAENNQEIWLHGSEGTVHLDFKANLLKAGQRGDKQLSEVKLIQDHTSCWRVEEEFIGAIRGEEKVRFTTFEEGVRYMEFTEAVAGSCRSSKQVNLPLDLN